MCCAICRRLLFSYSFRELRSANSASSLYAVLRYKAERHIIFNTLFDAFLKSLLIFYSFYDEFFKFKKFKKKHPVLYCRYFNTPGFTWNRSLNAAMIYHCFVIQNNNSSVYHVDRREWVKRDDSPVYSTVCTFFVYQFNGRYYRGLQKLMCI